jgi:hypothetical protein
VVKNCPSGFGDLDTYSRKDIGFLKTKKRSDIGQPNNKTKFFKIRWFIVYSLYVVVKEELRERIYKTSFTTPKYLFCGDIWIIVEMYLTLPNEAQKKGRNPLY